MQGIIDKNLVPKIQGVFVVGRKNWIPLDTVLDTGFNDEFCLPRKYFDECDLRFVGTDKYVLANGATVTEAIYLGTIVIDNTLLTALVSLTDDHKALIGTRLLDGKIATLDFKTYEVIVEE
ncbi:hypothetical protein HUU40_24455 [candidate division KSB1 bacterium]|nr:hypothetical protein [candidate division KSB1 bacterium]